MILSIVYLAIGLALILIGANILTDGSAALARRMGISDLVVGLTVVAFGTSTPELVTSILASLNGSAGLAIGNVVGSNIFNILAIIGITAMVRPLSVKRDVMTTEIPVVILSALLLIVMAAGPILDGADESIITRANGIILLIFFLLFMRETLIRSKKSDEAELPNPAENQQLAATQMPLLKSIIFIILGLAGLIAGGDRFVAGASEIARSLGVSDAIIGLTIVSAGTSMPELAAAVAAALKGNADMALGNVIGSNIFNILFILGTAAVVSPLPLGEVSAVDLGTLMLASVLFWLCGWFIGHRKITRGEGAMLTTLYIGYVAWLVYNAI